MALTLRHILLRVLFFHEPHDSETWVAQALEHDIAAFGQDIEQAKIAFERTVSGYIQLAEKHHQEPFVSLRPAPEGFWRIWQRVADQQTVQAEPILSIHAHMIPVVSDEPISTAQ